MGCRMGSNSGFSRETGWCKLYRRTGVGARATRLAGFFDWFAWFLFGYQPFPGADSNRRWQGPVFPGGVDSRMKDVISCSLPDGFGDAMVRRIVLAQHADEREVWRREAFRKGVMGINKPSRCDPTRVIVRVVDELGRDGNQ